VRDPPAVDQIEVNPYLTQDEVRGFCAEHQIAIEAWSPLARGQVLSYPAVESIARRTGKTPGPGSAALAHPAW
jgi:diketogulonate reductase-like aldo/keto reductase